MARRGVFWCFLVWASGVLAQEMVQVQTPAGTMHELARVSVGYFAMGSAAGRADEQPVHQVYLDEFYIDRFEVNNDQYASFLDAIGRNADGEGHLLLDVRDADAQIRYGDAGYAPIPWYRTAAGRRGLVVRCPCVLHLGRHAVADRGHVGKGRPRH